MLFVSPLEAVNLKIASLAPDGSIWDQAVEDMGVEWSEATDGRVRLRLYPGGVAGDEPDVLRKMRIGQLHGAVLTANGLTEIDSAFGVFSVPFFFDSYEELYHVLEALEPDLEKRLDAAGYQLVSWGHVGWIHLFSTEAITEVPALKRSKLFAPAGDSDNVQWWKSNGYNPVPLATTDVLSGLQTGMVDALPSPPLAALMLQWYRQAPHMLDLGFAPLIGATVVQKRMWRRLSAQDREALRNAGREMEEDLEERVPEQDRKAIEEMKKRGLTVHPVVGTELETQWVEAARNLARSVSEDRLPGGVMEQARKARDDFRKARREAQRETQQGEGSEGGAPGGAER